MGLFARALLISMGAQRGHRQAATAQEAGTSQTSATRHAESARSDALSCLLKSARAYSVNARDSSKADGRVDVVPRSGLLEHQTTGSFERDNCFICIAKEGRNINAASERD